MQMSFLCTKQLPFVVVLAFQLAFYIHFVVNGTPPRHKVIFYDEIEPYVPSYIGKNGSSLPPLMKQLSILKPSNVVVDLGKARHLKELSNDDGNAESVCVIIRTFFAHSPQSLITLVSSMLNSAKLANVKLHFVFADTDQTKPFNALPAIVEKINQVFGIHAEISPRTHANTKINFPAFNEKEFGFIVTDFAIEDVLKSPNSTCKFMMVSNGDNIYTRQFFPLIVQELRSGAQMVRFFAFIF